MEDHNYSFKVVLAGNSGVGKTCLIQTYTELQIWDTNGMERFRSVTKSYYRSAKAIILVYDIVRQRTFECLPDWLGDIEQHASPRVLKALVGNKVDRVDMREVEKWMGHDFADENKFDYFLETSALNATNVNRLFEEVAARLTYDMKQSQPDDTGKPCNSFAKHFPYRVTSLLASKSLGKGHSGVNQLGGVFVNGRPLPDTVRKQIVEYAELGVRPCDISRQLLVSHGCVSKILSKYYETGSISPGSSSGQITVVPPNKSLPDFVQRKITQFKEENVNVSAKEVKDLLFYYRIYDECNIPSVSVLSKALRSCDSTACLNSIYAANYHNNHIITPKPVRPKLD